jgi:hypothetical protein
MYRRVGPMRYPRAAPCPPSRGARRLRGGDKRHAMSPDYRDYEHWRWELVARGEQPATPGGLPPQVYIAERPDGWYVVADDPHEGLFYLYTFMGQPRARGPHPTRAAAVTAARARLGLAPLPADTPQAGC